MQGTLSLEDIVSPRSFSPRRPSPQRQGTMSLDDVLRSTPPVPQFATSDPFTGFPEQTSAGSLPPLPEMQLQATGSAPGLSSLAPSLDPASGIPTADLMARMPENPYYEPRQQWSPYDTTQMLAGGNPNFPAANQLEEEIRALGKQKSLLRKKKDPLAGLVPDDHKLSADDEKLLKKSQELAPDHPLGKPFTWDELANDPRRELPYDDPRRTSYEQDLLRQKTLVDTNAARRKAFLAKGDRGEWKLDDCIQYGMSLPYQMDFTVMYDPALRDKYMRLNGIATGQPVKDFGRYLQQQPEDRVSQMDRLAQLERDRKSLSLMRSQNPMDVVAQDDARAEAEKNLPTRLAESFGHGLAGAYQGVRDALDQDGGEIERRQYQDAYRAEIQGRADKTEAIPYAASIGRQTAESLGYMAPALVAGTLTGNAGVTYAMMGSQVGVTDYGIKKSEGWSDKEAILYGLGSAAVETASEILGGKFAGSLGLETAEEAASSLLKKNAKQAIVSPFAGIKQPVIRELVERGVGSLIEGGEEVAANFMGDVRDGVAALLGSKQKLQEQNQLDTFVVGVVSGGIMHAPHMAAFVMDPTNWKVQQAAGIPKEAFGTKEDAIAAAWIARELAKPGANSQNPADEVKRMQLDQIQPPPVEGESQAWKIAEKLGATREQFDFMVRNYDPAGDGKQWEQVLRPFFDEARMRKQAAAELRASKAQADQLSQERQPASQKTLQTQVPPEPQPTSAPQSQAATQWPQSAPIRPLDAPANTPGPYASRKTTPVDRSPWAAEQWLNDAINRSPQHLDAAGASPRAYAPVGSRHSAA